MASRVKDPSTDTSFIFDIGQHTLEFGRREFCLVTDFHFRDCCLDHLSEDQSCFRDRVFPGIARVKGTDLQRLLHSQTDFNNLLDDDDEVLNLVDDLSAWDNFPRGEHICDNRDFDHDSFSSFTDNRAALLNKITDMRVDFQRRVTAIEQYLKISTSSKVDQTSNVVRIPSCGSDNHDNHVKLGDKESMHVYRDYKVWRQLSYTYLFIGRDVYSVI
nr:phospholipase-like protein [Tanacetum cinerariifolium]